MSISTWTADETLALHKLLKKGKKTPEIARVLGKSNSSVRKKKQRMQHEWDSFLADPENYGRGQGTSRKWTQEEMIQLDAFLRAGKSYSFIAKEIDRSMVSVERQAQGTDWKAWRSVTASEREEEEKVSTEEKIVGITDLIIDAILTISRYDATKLARLTEDSFLTSTNLDSDELPCSFDELCTMAEEKLEDIGFANPESLELKSGRYIIVGDSHGKHTKKEMFALLRSVVKVVKPKNVIHLGHMLDDDNDISYEWGSIQNLIVVAKLEELRQVHSQRHSYNFDYDIVREGLTVGNLWVQNQDLIADYTKTGFGSLDSEIFDEKVVVNCHRLEMMSRCTHEERSYTVSPGCLCENHVTQTIKQIDFQDGKTVKQAYPEGFSKYRRMRAMYKFWNRGMLIVEVDNKGNTTVVPCLIQETDRGLATSYFDKIITAKGTVNPTNKIFVNCDLHSPLHDGNILDIQRQVCEKYKPDVQVNMGDTHNYSALNHHALDRGEKITDKILPGAAQTHLVLKKARDWAPEAHIIGGNHERFANDYIKKNPQFEDYLEFEFLCSPEDLGYKVEKIKGVIKIGSTAFIHGEMDMYGQTGNKLEKASRTFKSHVFIGHVHYPAIRFGCFSVGLTGLMDQDYNETEASRWIHGFGLCNEYRGVSWPTTIAILNNRCVLGGKTYTPVRPEEWRLKDFKARLVFDVD